MDQRKLSVFQVHTQLKKSEILGAKLNTSKTWRSISVTFGVFLVILGSLTAVAVDTNPEDQICEGVGSLVNGGFETLPPIAESPTTLTTVGSESYYLGQWHGYATADPVEEPRQIAYLFESESSNSPRITGWNTTASDGIIEIQRAVAGHITDANTPLTGTYFDTSGPRPAEGNFHAELSATSSGAALFQDISTVPGSTIRWSLKHRGRTIRTTPVEEMLVKIGSPSGALTTFRPNQRFTPTNSVWDQPATYSATADSTSGTILISGTLTDGWRLYEGSYTVPANQTTTRFQFEAVGGGSFGNLLDDIQFTPTLACPDETSVIVNRSAVTFSPIANDRRPNTGNALTVVSTTGTGTATVNGTNLQLSSTTVGSFTVRYRLTNSFGDTSEANVVVNVLSESTPRLPDVLLVDPRLNVVDFPQTTFENATNLLVCVQESDSGGSILGSPTVSFDVATKGTEQTSGSGSATISGDRTSTLLISHTRQNVLDTFNSSGGLRAYLSSGNFNSTRYVSVRTLPVATSTTAVTVASCADAAASASKTIEIRPLELTKTLRKGTIQLKN
jgi:hypothetical protein